MLLPELVAAELRCRQTLNPRFSLRRFARRLGVSHSTVSRLCRGRCRPTASTLRALASALGLPDDVARDEAAARAVDRLCALAAGPQFRADARWIAVRLGLSLDDVQLALHDALRRGRLRTIGPASGRADEGAWEVQSSAGSS